MTRSDRSVLFPVAFNDEKVAKVFVVVSDDTRRCLICDQLFFTARIV